MARTEFEGQIPFFLQNFLGEAPTAIPKGGQWVLVFEGPFVPSGNVSNLNYSLITPDGEIRARSSDDVILPVRAIEKAIDYEPKQWDIKTAIRTTLHSDFQQRKGCMFVQAVQLPGESTVVNPEGLQQGGYIRSYIGGGRDAFQTVSISFLETNISFVDNVIRPWVVATSHLGMLARKGPENYRCNFSVYKLGVISQDTSPYVALKYTFYGACPVSVTGEEYNYTQTNSPVNREATFTYHYYNIETDPTNLAINERRQSFQRQVDILDAQNKVLREERLGIDERLAKANSTERAKLLARSRSINNLVESNNRQRTNLINQIRQLR
jgi:hypothetical protein